MAAAGEIVPLVPNGTNRATLAGTGDAIAFTESFGPLTDVVSFNIRNGDVSAAKSMLIKATVPRFWHWVPVSGLDYRVAIRNTGAYVRSTFVHMTQHKPENMDAELVRKLALVVGVARAVITETYNITDSDLIPGERADPLLTADTATPGVVGIRPVSTATQEIQTLLRVPVVVKPEEEAVIAAVSLSALGIPPLQGYSLFMTQHHYLSDPKGQSRRAFDVVERSHWSGTAVKAWWDQHLEQMRDALWHKVGHPISLTIKMTLAQRDEVRQMLIAAGAAPAAARLPAMESSVRRGMTFKTLLQTVRPMYEDMGAVSNFLTLDEALAAVRHFPFGTTPSELPPLATIPAYVVDRKTALKHLEAVCDASSDTVAHAYGFYSCMAERTISPTGHTDTLSVAYSLESLKQGSPGAYHEGRSFYDDYRAKKAQDRANGKFGIQSLMTALVGVGGTETYTR